jgi:hypothetical protein
MKILKLSILAAAISLAGVAHADTLQLKRAASDLIPSSLAQAKSAAAPVAGETEAVHFAWALDAGEALSAPEPYRAESREFWTQLDAAKAKQGWGFVPTADGALVRISLQGVSKGRSLRAADVQLRVDGQPRDSASVIEHLAGDADLKAVGAQFSDGTLVFQLLPGLAGKRIEVALPKSAAGALMHVLEPNSTIAMELSASAIQAMPGQRVTLDARFLDQAKARSAKKVAGLITAPDGRSFDLEFRIDKAGRAVAHFDIPADAGGGLEPWEIHAFGSTDLAKNVVLRDARTAVMVSRPTARFAGEAELLRRNGGVVFQLPVETAADGRYELRGTLYGSDASGELKPMAIAHGAQVLSAGRGVLELRFTADVLNPTLAAPYALRDLSLSDQSRLSLSERRHEALDIPSLP